MSDKIASLELELQSNTAGAVKGLEALANTLGKIKRATQGGLGLNAVTNELKNQKKATDELVKSNDKLQSSNKKSSKSFVEMGAKITAAFMSIKKVGNMIGGFIQESNNYVENMNLFTVSMGQYADEARKYAENVSELTGIDVSDWARNQGVFMTLATGFGVAGDRANTMSQQLTQLGYDISSFYNIKVEDAMQKLQSGISGELEPLRRLGYDLSQAKLEATALSLGITKSVSSMTQAEKAQLRYHAIMTQVTTSHHDMARTIESPANQLRILSSQVKQAGRAIGNIFIPALTAVLPYVNAFFQIVKAVADVIAGLFGYEFPEFDPSGIDGMVGGTNDLTDGLDNATDAAKKLKSYTMGFDELNVIDPNSGKSDDTDGADDAFNFELPTYDFLEGLDGGKVNEIVDGISEKLKNTLVITEELQTALDSLGTEQEIPVSVSMVTESVVLTAQNIFFTIMDYLNGLLYDTDWGSFGNTIGTLISVAITSIDFSGIINRSQAFSLGMSIAILDLLSGAIDGVEWGKVLSHLVTEIEETIRGLGKLDWGRLGSSITGVFTSIFNAIKEVDWYELGTALGNLVPVIWGAIKEAVGNVDWATLASSIFEALGGAIAGASSLAVGLAKSLWQSIVDAWDSVKGYFKDKINQCGGDVANGIWEGIKQPFVNAFQWIKTHIFEPFMKGFKEVFGIHSPSTVMEEQGGFLVAGLLQGITNAWSNIVSFFSEKWEALKSGISETWDSIKTTASSKWDSIKTTVSEKWGNIASFFSEKWGALKSGMSETWDSIKTTVSEKWGNIASFFSEKWGALKSGMSETWDSIKTTASSKWDSIKTTVSSKWDSIKTTCSEKFGNIKTKVSDTWEGIKTTASSKWDSIKTTVSSKWDSIKTTASTTFTGLKDGVVGIWEGIWTNIKKVVNWIIGGIETLANGVIKGVNFIFTALNKIKVDVPDWVTDLTDMSAFGFNFKLLTPVTIPRLMADGGFVDTGELFVAREAGAEMVGSIGRRTAVANNDQIVAGITSGVAEANSEQNALLREQNQLLRALLDKESNVTMDGRKVSKQLDRVRRERGATIVTGGAY